MLFQKTDQIFDYLSLSCLIINLTDSYRMLAYYFATNIHVVDLKTIFCKVAVSLEPTN